LSELQAGGGGLSSGVRDSLRLGSRCCTWKRQDNKYELMTGPLLKCYPTSRHGVRAMDHSQARSD
jgi:hypothetical protein